MSHTPQERPPEKVPCDAKTPTEGCYDDDKTRTGMTSNASSCGLDNMAEKQPPTATTPTSSPPKSKWWSKKEGSSKEQAATTTPSDDSPPPIKPASIASLFRYATSYELVLNAIGLVVAAIAGATLPCMTIVFGRLISVFTEFGTVVRNISTGIISPEDAAPALESAKAALKKEAGNCALYLLAMGIGMFIVTYTYMLIWNYTSEAQSKRLRESYLRAVLRQEVRTSESSAPTG